jgi:hypothetical protein
MALKSLFFHNPPIFGKQNVDGFQIFPDLNKCRYMYSVPRSTRMLVEDLVLDTTSCAGPNEEEERYISQSFTQNSSTKEPFSTNFLFLLPSNFFIITVYEYLGFYQLLIYKTWPLLYSCGNGCEAQAEWSEWSAFGPCTATCRYEYTRPLVQKFSPTYIWISFAISMTIIAIYFTQIACCHVTVPSLKSEIMWQKIIIVSAEASGRGAESVLNPGKCVLAISIRNDTICMRSQFLSKLVIMWTHSCNLYRPSGTIRSSISGSCQGDSISTERYVRLCK